MKIWSADWGLRQSDVASISETDTVGDETA